ncbi:hypothetical protein [Marinobacterium arenosum]|uniref:hypothetical protein n=1 Tax=Marinobacterium arenosum TaxID=2862496 RepID=UPI001C961065|nr:hypothetical protein [Marinobacterium arenosum]MBY4676938.1 hypothetical protein [Marinobacterium arenosum]
MDRHNTKKISRILAAVVSAFFAAVAVAGYSRTEDLGQLLLFLGLSAFSYLLVIFIFKGIDKLLDSVDDREH